MTVEPHEDAPYAPPPTPTPTPMASDELQSVTLASAIDIDGFRATCRRLWSLQVPPGHVSWHSADDAEGDLFESPVASTPVAVSDAGVGASPLRVPPSFLDLCESVVLHRDPGRFGLLYRLLWRMQHEPNLRHDALDADGVHAKQMAQAVRRDMHKMTAFVRFRTLAANEGASALHVAWFEPEHHIVEATSPFFMRRFANIRWAILTPERSVEWDGTRLQFGPGARKDEAPPADAGERLWLTYYEHIFNPARLKRSMMLREMPRRYWANLPEAVLIDPLSARAAERSTTMVESAPTEPTRRIPIASHPAPRVLPHPTPGHAELPGGEAPASLPALRDALERCRECPIGEHATQAVPGEGSRRARIMFVGEQPGDQEDLQGRPFVGPAGQLFGRALAELGIDRKEAYITNAVKHFKFELRGKRRIHKTPAQQEAAACLHWLESEIGLVEPEVLVALGATAARQLMGTSIAVTRMRGQFLKRGDGRRVLITLHPSALLRMEPADKEAAWTAWLADLRLLAPH